MARKGEEALVADGLGVVGLAKTVLLHVAHTLHGEADGEEDDAGNVPAGAKVVLGVARDVGGVEQGDGQGDEPDPEHLEDPEAQEGEELVALVIEAVVGAGAQDAEEEEAREADGPGDEEEGGDELTGVVVAGQGEGEDGEQGKVGAAGEIWLGSGRGVETGGV